MTVAETVYMHKKENNLKLSFKIMCKQLLLEAAVCAWVLISPALF